MCTIKNPINTNKAIMEETKNNKNNKDIHKKIPKYQKFFLVTNYFKFEWIKLSS